MTNTSDERAVSFSLPYSPMETLPKQISFTNQLIELIIGEGDPLQTTEGLDARLDGKLPTVLIHFGIRETKIISDFLKVARRRWPSALHTDLHCVDICADPDSIPGHVNEEKLTPLSRLG